MATSYVRFYRGSVSAFNNLATKNNDTLYFITDSDNGKSSLYLGDKLITGGITELSDFEDILLSKALIDNQILVFDGEKEKWINKGLIEAIGIMIGANSENQGGAGLVPAPGIGDQGKFLRGDGNWVNIETGSYYFGDEKTIESDGVTFFLNDFEKKYYAYIPASGSEEDGNFVAAHYEAREVSEANPWKENLEPKVVKENDIFVLGWFEPNPTLLDGVIDELSSLQNQINNTNKVIENLQSADGAFNAELANKANKSSVYTKEETEDKINELISNAQHLIRKIFNTIEEAEAFVLTVDNPADYVYMVKNTSTTASDKYTEYLYIDNELEPVGSWDVDLDQYITENKLATALNSKVDKEDGKTLISATDVEKLAGIEEGAEKNFISAVNNAEFNVKEGQLELKAIAISKVTDLEALLNSKANVSAVTTLEGTIATVSGNVNSLITKTSTLEENLSTVTSSVSDLTELLNSSYVMKDELTNEMSLVYGELGAFKEAITWVTLN